MNIKTIDMIVLGMINGKEQSAQELLNNVQSRNIVYWVKTSDSSIYKKVISLEQKGYLQYTEKVENQHVIKYYYITESGKKYLYECMEEGTKEALRLYVDYNAVMINFCNVSKEKQKELCDYMQHNIEEFNAALKETNMKQKQVPLFGELIVLQQMVLGDAMESWIKQVQERIG